MDAYKKKFNVEPDENTRNAYSYTDCLIKGVAAAGRWVSLTRPMTGVIK